MGLKREGSGLSVKGTTITGYDEEKAYNVQYVRLVNSSRVKKATRTKQKSCLNRPKNN